MTYTVEHYNTQGFFERARCLNEADVRAELNRFATDVVGTGNCSKAFNESDKCIAFRHWDKKRISWIVKPGQKRI